jgi:hypothetical protein
MSELQKKLKKELTKSVVQFLKKENELLNSLSYTSHLESFETYLEEHNLMDDVFLFMNRNKVDYEKSRRKLMKVDTSMRKVNAGMVYKLYYQNFEELLSNFICSIYLVYPKFIEKENDYNQFEIESINNITTANIRKIINDKKVNELIQSDNINVILKKVKIVFGLDLPISEEEIKLIMFFSMNRNLLNTNNGIINSLFLAEVKRFNLISDYELDENISSTLEKLTVKIQVSIPKIASKIYEFLVSNVPQIELCSETQFEVYAQN